MLRQPGYQVPPLSMQQIEQIATDMRAAIGCSQIAALPLVQLLEFALPQAFPDFEFHVLSRTEMGDDQGRTYPQKRVIQLREDVYIGFVRDNGKDRFTVAHELGHLFLHASDIPLQRHTGNEAFQAFRDSEWQADAFAAAFLMPRHLMANCVSPEDVARIFVVSWSAAQTRWNKLISKK